MQRSLLLTSALSLAFGVNAALAPTERTALATHMLEVNAQWRVQDPAHMVGHTPVTFSSDAQRIATHLHRVCARLKVEPRTGLSPQQAANRQDLLTRLEEYADRGRFPQNYVRSYRTPVFIDPHGTACAVGQLMIESGNRVLAEAISGAMNLGYVLDMPWPEVADWGTEHGFTAGELAWIQPTYAPTIAWAAMGGGTNGEVKELLRLSNGDMLVAGTFTQAGGTNANYVARYDGATYTALPGLPAGEVRTAIEFNGTIYLGGSFSQGNMDLAKWSGNSWSPEAAFASKYSEVNDLHVSNGVLYAAGFATGFAGISHEVRRLVGNSWEMVGQALNGPIRTLESSGDELICGGDFTGYAPWPDDTLVQHVAFLNGNNWQQLADGLDGRVFDLMMDGNLLYAGGDMLSEMTTHFGLARINLAAQVWEQLMPNIEWYISSPTDGLVHINALLAHDGSIYFGGDFMVNTWTSFGNCMGAWNGEPDMVSALAALNGPVNDLDLLGTQQLVMGGGFSTNNNADLHYVATTDLSTGIDAQRTDGTYLSAWPNPTTEQLTIRTDGVVRNVPVRIVDATGRTVMSSTLRQQTSILDVQALATGTYSVLVDDGNKHDALTFIKR